MSLLQAYFPQHTEPEWQQMLDRLFATNKKRRIVRTAGLEEVLQSADLENPEDFADFKQEFQDQVREDLILRRLGGLKSAKAFSTPVVIKNLRPAAAGCVLNFQHSTSSFQGYCRRALTEAQLQNKRVKPYYSTSAKFGLQRTQEAALRMVVTFLWKKHKEAGKDPLASAFTPTRP